MRFPRLGWFVAIALAVVSTGHEASARGLAPGVPPVPVTQMSHTYGPGIDQSVPVCQLGMVGTPVSAQPVLDFDPVNGDYYYTWLNLDSLSCTNCGLGTYGEITAAHVAIYFPTAPETMIVSVSIVGIVNTACRFQDPNVVYCPGFDYELTWQDPALTNDFAIPFPQECRLEVSGLGNGQGFLEYNFRYSSLMQPGDRPQLVTQASVLRCRTFVPISFPQQDWVDLFEVGNPIMYVDVQQCLHVPVVRQSWGRLKQIYR